MATIDKISTKITTSISKISSKAVSTIGKVGGALLSTLLPDPSPLFSTSISASNYSPTSDNFYYKSTTFNTTSSNFTFTVTIPAINQSNTGVHVLGVYDQNTGVFTAGVDRAFYSSFWRLARKRINYAYTNYPINTICYLRAVKSGSTLTFYFLDSSSSVIHSDPFTLIAGHTYRIAIEVSTAGDNWNGTLTWSQT